MLCQLCSGLNLAAIMQLRLEPDFSPMRASKEDFSPEQVADWDSFEESENLFHFLLYKSNPATYKYEDAFVPYHETLGNLYHAAQECALCRVLLQSAAGIIKIRKGINGSPFWQNSSGEGLFLCGLGNGQGIQLMALDRWYTSRSYTLLGGLGFSVDDALSPTKIGREESKGIAVHFISLQDKVCSLQSLLGLFQPLTLNTGTKHQLEKGLPIEAFPKTFQDAFWVIRQLDIPYIWIDSLCIVQDDNDDWVHESARMCDVYGNAYLTIAATRARNCSEGFLGTRDGSEYTHIPFNQGGINGNVAVFPMPLSRVSPWSEIIDLEEEPLSERAWALQERYLSPRTLHFASTQIYFECGLEFQAEDWHLEQKDTRVDFKIHRRATEKDNNSADAWDTIVRSPGDDYLAGLWRKSLLWVLAWHTFDQDAKRSAPEAYTAPSWSWASVNQPVAFSSDQDQSLAIVKGAKVDLEKSESPFGRVTGGWVHLSGIKLRPCDVDNGYGELYFREGDARFRVSTNMDPSRFNLSEVRLADYRDKKSELVAVPLMLHFEQVESGYEEDNPVLGTYFLILISLPPEQSPIDGLPCFRRVGLGTSYNENLDGNDVDARRRLRDRCLQAMITGTLEDIIIL
ncbi:unnamed protein product [Fusarium equiseti]|uniref:Heterokaryon incompatibility domain-containing protein n=1 Tax=Fusarium equiseti TaxID=61235 RepID=A0A8J2IWG2_FUSEQ|nr:unnamed protein product [Fusarium equiseti]